MNTLYLCGAGNSEGVRLALNVNQAQHRWDAIYLLDDDSTKHNRALLGVTIVGPISVLADVEPAAGHCEVANLVSRTTRKRAAVHQRLASYGVRFATLLSPDIDTFGVELTGDLVAYQHAVLGPEVTIDSGSVIFMGGIVGHESRVGKFCVIAANAVLNARVHLDDGVYVGTNATVLPEVSIGAGATIAAGSVVIDDVPPGATAIGVPAQIMSPSTESSATIKPCVGAAPFEVAAPLEVERYISKVWKEVLHVRNLDSEKSFFDLGGDSLLALRVCGQIKHDTGVQLSIVDVFQYPSVKTLSQALAGRLSGGRPTPLKESVVQSRAAIRRAMHQRDRLR